ncbi:MAG: PD-(D/E)XK nuclease family protein [Pelagibacterales bacterium]|nr:PD-(D/E)XK nuclease family protein [Pelagibacterales bacterium]
MINIENVYHSYLEQENTNNRKKYEKYKGWFSASSAGSCYKKILLRAEGVKEPPFDSRVMRLLRLGTVVHEDIQKAIKSDNDYNKEDCKIFIERKVKIPELNLIGHLDVAVFNKKSLELKVWDIKTCASYKWKKMFGRNAETGGSQNYKLQLGTYAGALAQELETLELEMALLWYNKDTSAMREQFIGNEWIQSAMEYWEELNDFLESDTSSNDLNPGDYGVPMENWECKYCNYKDINCKGI